MAFDGCVGEGGGMFTVHGQAPVHLVQQSK